MTVQQRSLLLWLLLPDIIDFIDVPAPVVVVAVAVAAVLDAVVVVVALVIDAVVAVLVVLGSDVEANARRPTCRLNRFLLRFLQSQCLWHRFVRCGGVTAAEAAAVVVVGVAIAVAVSVVVAAYCCC